jgi:hypothetical protein
MACVIHPGSQQVTVIGGRGYCAACQRGIRAAVARLDAHVTPPDCFVWYKNSAEGWTPIFGTGCAHYVSHQMGINFGTAADKCLAGFTYRVPVMLTGRTRVTGGLSAVRVGDIWVNTARSHTGIVSRIDPPAAPAPVARPRPGAPAPVPILWITNASSGQHRLATDRFDLHFGSQGDFFR